jgi:hypothetical protein
MHKSTSGSFGAMASEPPVGRGTATQPAVP